MEQPHVCVYAIFSASGCPDGDKCPALRTRRRRPWRPRSGRRPRVQAVEQGWTGLTVFDLFRAGRRYTPSTDRVLDLGTRWRDVVRIARSQGLYSACIAAGWTAEDLDQELVLEVCRKQTMPSRYDPERGSVGKYLYTAVRSVMLHLIERRRVVVEEIDERCHGTPDPDDGMELENRIQDLAVAGVVGSIVPEVARRLVLGETPRAIAIGLGVEPSQVREAIEDLRQVYSTAA